MLVPRGGSRAQRIKDPNKLEPMLGTIFALGRFLGALGHLLRVSWLLVGVLGRFFCVRERPGLDFGGFGSLPGRFLELPTFIFQVF